MSSESTLQDQSMTAARHGPAESFVLFLVMLIALSQLTIGGKVSETGEQIGLGVPLSTIFLGLALLVVLLLRRELRRPNLPWYWVLFMTAVPIGILGLNRADLGSALKSLVQVAEIFVITWYLLATASNDVRRRLARIIGYTSIPFGLLILNGSYSYLGLSETRYAGLLLLMLPFAVYSLRSHRLILMISLGVIGLAQGFFLTDGGLLLGFILILALSGLVSPGLLRVVLPAVAIAAVVSLLAPGTTAWDTLNPEYDAQYRKRLFIEYDAAMLAPRKFPAGGGPGRYKNTINILKLHMPNAIASPEENTIRPDSNMQYLLTLVESGSPAALGLLLLILGSIWTAWRHKLHATEVDVSIARAVCVALAALLWAGLFTSTLGRGIGIWAGALLGWSNALRLLPRSIGWKPLFLRLAPPALSCTAVLFALLAINREPGPIDRLSTTTQYLRGMIDPEEKPVSTNPPATNGLRIVKLSELEDDGAAMTDQNTVRIEGENFTECTPPFRVVEVNDASGNKAIGLASNAGKDSGSVVYTIDLPKAGTYRLTARVRWNDGCSNSLGFIIDDNTYMITSETYQTWHMLPVRQALELRKGVNTIRLRNLEDGILMDYFELTRE